MQVLLWERRVEKGLTDERLAEITGLSKSTINNIENGKTSPTLNQLRVIAIALDCRITDLFNDEYK